MNPEHYEVTGAGDALEVETPFGTARFELKDANQAADENVRDGHGEWPDDFDLEDRWRVLFDEVEVATELWENGEL